MNADVFCSKLELCRKIVCPFPAFFMSLTSFLSSVKYLNRVPSETESLKFAQDF